MLTQTITAPAVSAAKVFPAPRTQGVPAVDQFSVIATCAGVIASEFSYRKDEANVQVPRNLWIVTANDPRHAEDICCFWAARPRWKKLPPSCWKWTAGSSKLV
jgi:hypothetical protein